VADGKPGFFLNMKYGCTEFPFITEYSERKEKICAELK
jgi:hypothetical protein